MRKNARTVRGDRVTLEVTYDLLPKGETPRKSLNNWSGRGGLSARPQPGLGLSPMAAIGQDDSVLFHLRISHTPDTHPTGKLHAIAPAPMPPKMLAVITSSELSRRSGTFDTDLRFVPSGTLASAARTIARTSAGCMVICPGLRPAHPECACARPGYSSSLSAQGSSCPA